MGSLFSQNNKSTNSLLIPLKPVSLKKLSLKLGYDLKGAIPEEGLEGIIFGKSYIFIDLNGDGAFINFTDEGQDGLVLKGNPFVVYLPKALLLPKGQFKLRFEYNKEKKWNLILDEQELWLSPQLVTKVSALTEIRFRAGVAPVLINEEASRHCELHLNYLLKNPSNGMAQHEETLGNLGYTQEGAKAGRESNLSSSSLDVALLNCYASAWHGPPLVNPNLKTIGIMENSALSMIYFYETALVKTYFLHPADGAINIPCSFSKAGELPNPVHGTENGKGSGYPIFIMLPAEKPQDLIFLRVIEKDTEKAVKGTSSSPIRLANPEWPTNSLCATFIPSAPLKSNTTYEVKFGISDEKTLFEWSFTTGSN